MKNQNMSSLFNMFSQEQCFLEESIALGKRVGNAVFEIFSINDGFIFLSVSAELENEKLLWKNPQLTLCNNIVLDLLADSWQNILKEQEFYKNCNVDDKQTILENIKEIVQLLQSYFPYYAPQNAKSSFRMDKKGYIFASFENNTEDELAGKSFGVLRV